MEGFEDLLDWQALREYIQPLAGLLIALAFMAFVRLMRASRKRSPAPPDSKRPELPVARKRQGGVAPIEPGDDAAKLSRQFSQQRSR
jgi:hypothetical protein